MEGAGVWKDWKDVKPVCVELSVMATSTSHVIPPNPLFCLARARRRPRRHSQSQIVSLAVGVDNVNFNSLNVNLAHHHSYKICQ
jgi:hypothetical protein